MKDRYAILSAVLLIPILMKRRLWLLNFLAKWDQDFGVLEVEYCLQHRNMLLMTVWTFQLVQHVVILRGVYYSKSALFSWHSSRSFGSMKLLSREKRTLVDRSPLELCTKQRSLIGWLRDCISHRHSLPECNITPSHVPPSCSHISYVDGMQCKTSMSFLNPPGFPPY